ncbi:MAG: DEAD/DEAH box helicase [Acholeplasmatales bacterium]|nr:DEAD/DEAH box helicase [Acholeplasmatales bacterium]
MDFIEFGIDENLIKALNKNGILSPTPIQEKAIPLLLEGKDVIGGSQTGSGKTFAYSIPLIQKIEKKTRGVKALILCPTRELSLQVKGELDKLIEFYKLNCVTIYGGESYVIQNKRLKSNPDIIIGTPGRIIDQMNKGNLSFENVNYLVLDEADEMLKMGFEADLETILSTIPETRQTALFSATLPPFVRHVSEKYMTNPTMVQIENKTLTVESIDQIVYYVKSVDKKNSIIRLLDYYEFKHIMIFCNTKAMVDELLVFLQNNNFKAEGLHGDLKQVMRDRVMSQFRAGAVDILIATDVAARGIDIDDIDCVINYDLPNENELYVHRIGRTGRRGRSGVAISLASSRGRNRVKELEKYSHQQMTVSEIPTVEKIKEAYQKKIYLNIKEAVENSGDSTYFDNMIKKFSRESSDPIPLIRALISMIYNDNVRDYPDIEYVKFDSKSKRDRNDRKSKDNKKSSDNKKSNDNKNKKDKFVVIEVNLGEGDKVNNNKLINILHDELLIHRERFGKISVNKTRTFFELESDALRFLDTKKKVKINGKTLQFRLVDKKLR